MFEAVIKTPIGKAKLVATEKGLQSFTIADDSLELTHLVPDKLMPIIEQIEEYFNHNLKIFSIDYDFQGTDFQKKVWQELLNVPYGKTISYQELTNRLGDPLAIRAVAGANGKNKLWILVPCHRVIGSDGSLTGYAGGLWRKKWLLEHEGTIGKQESLF